MLAAVGQVEREEIPGGVEVGESLAAVRRMPEPGRPRSYHAQMAARYQHGEAAEAIDGCQREGAFHGAAIGQRKPI